MSVELEERRAQVEKRMALLLRDIDPTMRELYQTLLEKDDEEGLDEDRKVARLEGFHDYIVVREVTGHEHPSIEEFVSVRRESPEALISFGTGKRRVSLEGEDDPVDDTVEDADLEDEDVVDAELEEEVKVYEGEGGHLPREEISAASAASPDEDVDDDEVEDEEVEVESLDNAETLSDENAEESTVEQEVKSETVSPDDKGADVKEDATPGRINADAIATKRFSEKRGGYNKDLVDDFLDEAVPFFSEKSHTAEEYDAEIIRLKNHSLKGAALRVGFNTQEVDGYITAMVGELENRKTEK